MSDVPRKDDPGRPATETAVKPAGATQATSQAEKASAITSAPPRPAAAKPATATRSAAAAGPPASEEELTAGRRRRRIVWAAIAGYLVTNFFMFLRFFLPRTLFEPRTQFTVGFPSDFGFGVETKFQKDYRIWVVRNAERIFAIYARCTHLGCTPDWKSGENKFKCPCHGSGFDSEGINFEGPAPRPLDRAQIEVAPDGQLLVNTSILYEWPKGARSEFNDPGSFVQV